VAGFTKRDMQIFTQHLFHSYIYGNCSTDVVRVSVSTNYGLRISVSVN